MPRKVFVAGEILTAAAVNENLMDQAVMSFAGSAARGSAIPTPVEGMAAYLNDQNILSLYDGSAWKNSLGVTGGILQVVQTVKTDTFSASVASGASTALTGLTASITPSSTSNKLLIQFSISGQNDSSTRGMGFIITANSSAVSSVGDSAGSRTRISYSVSNVADRVTIETTSGMFLYSPNSTSAQTIGINLVQLDTGTNTILVNRSGLDTDNAANSRAISTLTVMEVAA